MGSRHRPLCHFQRQRAHSINGTSRIYRRAGSERASGQTAIPRVSFFGKGILFCGSFSQRYPSMSSTAGGLGVNGCIIFHRLHYDHGTSHWPPPPDVRDDSRVSCLLCFQERPARDSTAEHGPASTMDGDSVGEGFPVRTVVFADSFSLLSVHSVSPLDIMQASNTRTATRMAAFWVSSFSFLSLFWVPASTMDSG